jgi:hypothetical protein
MVLSTLASERELHLAQLYGHGLRRLEIARTELIETDSDQYDRTVPWAAALHASDPAVDGLVWVSRQHDDAYAMVLFGDRVARQDLRVVEPPLPLDLDAGFEEVRRAAEQAGITIVE